MLKVKISLFFILIAMISSNAQQFAGGLLIGINGSQVDGDLNEGYHKLNLMAGTYTTLQLNTQWTASAELYFTGKGAKAIENIDKGVSGFKTSLYYVEMPFFINYRTTKKVELSAGLAFAYLFGHRLEKSGYVVPKSDYRLGAWDFSGLAKVSYPLTEKMCVSVRFSYSLLPFDDAGWFNNVLGVGGSFKL